MMLKNSTYMQLDLCKLVKAQARVKYTFLGNIKFQISKQFSNKKNVFIILTLLSYLFTLKCDFWF